MFLKCYVTKDNLFQDDLVWDASHNHPGIFNKHGVSQTVQLKSKKIYWKINKFSLLIHPSEKSICNYWYKSASADIKLLAKTNLRKKYDLSKYLKAKHPNYLMLQSEG